MNEEKLIKFLLRYSKRVFPKKCNCCGKIYSTYREFLLQTKSIGNPVSYDDDFDSGKKKIKFKIVGTTSFFNCTCGTTLAIGTGGMNIISAMRIMLWSRGEAKRRNQSWSEFVHEMRKKVHQRVLGLETWKKMNRILLLDEDTYSSNTLLKYLNSGGYKVYRTSSVEDAVDLLYEKKVKLLIINFSIIEMGNYNLDNFRVEYLHVINVLVVLDKFIEYDKKKLIEILKKNGVNGILYKPFNMDFVKMLLRKVI